MKNEIFMKLLRLIATFSNRLQGKGFGSTSIDFEIKAVAKFTKDSPRLAVDIGANVGNYTDALLQEFSNISIHAFEPSKATFVELSARFGNDQRIHLSNFALGNVSETRQLFSDSNLSGLASLTRRRLDHFHMEMKHEESVKVRPFVEYWKNELESQYIDIVKIDVEGHELDVLNGFHEALEHCRVIQFEFGGCNIDTRTYFQDFWYFFVSRNFEIYRITPLGPSQIHEYSESDEIFQTTNFIAVNRKTSS